MNTGDTTPIVHAGKLFALKESSPPMRLDPHSLKTFGEYDFDGALTAQTFTAHPKIDPVSGEMIAFSYEAKGKLTDDLAVHFVDRDGKLLHWVYDRHAPAWVGILPRDGDAKDVRWFKGPHDRAMLIHATNARTEGNKVIADAQRLEEGPFARVLLPFRLHMQVHGWWVPATELPFDFDVDPDFVGGPYV